MKHSGAFRPSEIRIWKSVPLEIQEIKCSIEGVGAESILGGKTFLPENICLKN